MATEDVTTMENTREGHEGLHSTLEELQSKVEKLQDREKQLVEERARLEEDFGHRRAKLKELYLQKEEELRAQADNTTARETEVELLQAQVRQLQQELEEAHSAATIAQCTAENKVAVEQRKCQEEIATVHQLMKEEVANAVGQTGGRYEGEIKRLKKLTERLDAEKQHYRRLYERQLEESDIRTKGESLLSPGVLSAVTKSLAKRVPSLSPSALSTPEKTTANASSGSGVDAESLEDSMKRAQEDADLLRSLVEPLEEEIQELKEKIRAQDAQLRAHEAQQAAALHTADLVAPLLRGTDAAQVVKQLDEKLKGVSSTLEAEKASRADLELYTAILNTQKTALTDDVDRLRTQLTELRRAYENERREHRELKHTWQRANDQFLEAQRLHLADMRRMQSLLSNDQLRKLEDLQRSEESSGGKVITNESNTSEGRLDTKSASPLLSSLSPAARKPGSSHSLDNEIDDDRSSSLLDLDEENPATQPLLTANTTTTTLGDQSDDQSSEAESHSLPPDLLAPDSMLAERFSPDKMPQLTHDQQKALADATPDSDGLTPSEPLLSPGEDEDLAVELPSSGVGGLGGQVGLGGSGRRVVSEAEWNLLHEEIRRARLRFGRSCQLCAANQTNLHKVQSEQRETEKQKVELERALTRYSEDLDREANYRQMTEEKWRVMADDYKAKVVEVSGMVDAATEKYTMLEDKFKATETSLQLKLKELTRGREEVQSELTRLQNENDKLVGKHSQHSQELQNEIINLPDNMEDMQLLLLRYREDIIAAKVSKEHIEESLKSEILFLKDQVLAEQHEKNSMEDRLSVEMDQLREKVAMLESVESQMRMEQKNLAESEAQVARQAEVQLKSKQIISGLKTQVAEQTQARARLEAEVMELKGRVTTLQHDLDTSEAVQRDFVRLSQSLQVQLEKIRQSEKEVRWQHEEDQEECNSCKQRFSAMGRRKHHCRHCGKIFCNECVNKSVPSGPHRRPSRVCDVCHTLLVQDATPYFSSEPPHSPD
ncbi:hypothetical protein Pcinc_010939 [Petrolisthes cinctipes]|uniref:FYVE-type domain-containing protein n=1 Tax=Petrolisthes cinctipes TaxID=88211 RepID=A0AAE1KT42_PETCI|nr:hypothetical protein Pcinc_010939 [Petrolisthes cinctipes]